MGVEENPIGAGVICVGGIDANIREVGAIGEGFLANFLDAGRQRDGFEARATVKGVPLNCSDVVRECYARQIGGAFKGVISDGYDAGGNCVSALLSSRVYIKGCPVFAQENPIGAGVICVGGIDADIREAGAGNEG